MMYYQALITIQEKRELQQLQNILRDAKQAVHVRKRHLLDDTELRKLEDHEEACAVALRAYRDSLRQGESR